MKAARGDGTVQKRLANFLLALMTTSQETTKEAPASLFLGRIPYTRLTLLKPTVAMNVERCREKMYDRGQTLVRTFEEGETVAVRDYRISQPGKWTAGIISEQTGPLSYKVAVAPGGNWRRHTDQIHKSRPNDHAPTNVADLEEATHVTGPKPSVRRNRGRAPR